MGRTSSSGSPAPPRFAASDLTVRFGRFTALSSVSIEVPAGQVVGVIGPNGAGKTTLLDVIGGATRPAGGRISFDGAPLHPRKAQSLAQLGIARTAQGLGLPEAPTVIEHLLSSDAPAPRTAIGAALRVLPRVERAGEGPDPGHVAQVIKEMGLTADADAAIQTLSLAAQIRVAIGRAMVGNPRLLLLDEPSAGLGPEERSDLAVLIRHLATRPGRDCSVVLVAHHFDLIEQACDAVSILDDGAVVAHGTPADGLGLGV